MLQFGLKTLFGRRLKARNVKAQAEGLGIRSRKHPGPERAPHFFQKSMTQETSCTKLHLVAPNCGEFMGEGYPLPGELPKSEGARAYGPKQHYEAKAQRNAKHPANENVPSPLPINFSCHLVCFVLKQ